MKTRSIRLGLLLGLGKIVPVSVLRPMVANLLTKESSTSEGYISACERLVEPHLIDKKVVQPLSPSWWKTLPVVKTERLGLKLSLDLRDNLQRCIYYTGKYEPKTLAILEKEIQKGDTFIDVGAHIGIHSLLAAKKLKDYGTGRVIAFEPTIDSQQKVMDNFEANDLPIDLQKIALGNQKSELYLYGDKNWGVHDAAVRSFYGNGEVIQKVQVEKFDEWAEQHSLNSIDIIKIDAEGAEYNILLGMKESLHRFKPRCIMFEIKQSLLDKANVTYEEILELMSEMGYSVKEEEIVEGNYFFRYQN